MLSPTTQSQPSLQPYIPIWARLLNDGNYPDFVSYLGVCDMPPEVEKIAL